MPAKRPHPQQPPPADRPSVHSRLGMPVRPTKRKHKKKVYSRLKGHFEEEEPVLMDARQIIKQRKHFHPPPPHDGDYPFCGPSDDFERDLEFVGGDDMRDYDRDGRSLQTEAPPPPLPMRRLPNHDLRNELMSKRRGRMDLEMVGPCHDLRDRIELNRATAEMRVAHTLDSEQGQDEEYLPELPSMLRITIPSSDQHHHQHASLLSLSAPVISASMQNRLSARPPPRIIQTEHDLPCITTPGPLSPLNQGGGRPKQTSLSRRSPSQPDQMEPGERRSEERSNKRNRRDVYGRTSSRADRERNEGPVESALPLLRETPDHHRRSYSRSQLDRIWQKEKERQQQHRHRSRSRSLVLELGRNPGVNRDERERERRPRHYNRFSPVRHSPLSRRRGAPSQSPVRLLRRRSSRDELDRRRQMGSRRRREPSPPVRRRELSLDRRRRSPSPRHRLIRRSRSRSPLIQRRQPRQRSRSFVHRSRTPSRHSSASPHKNGEGSRHRRKHPSPEQSFHSGSSYYDNFELVGSQHSLNDDSSIHDEIVEDECFQDVSVHLEPLNLAAPPVEEPAVLNLSTARRGSIHSIAVDQAALDLSSGGGGASRKAATGKRPTDSTNVKQDIPSTPKTNGNKNQFYNRRSLLVPIQQAPLEQVTTVSTSLAPPAVLEPVVATSPSPSRFAFKKSDRKSSRTATDSSEIDARYGPVLPWNRWEIPRALSAYAMMELTEAGRREDPRWLAHQPATAADFGPGTWGLVKEEKDHKLYVKQEEKVAVKREVEH
ncbi:hypothetical protein BV898_11882 [Hypsibius exemplaris]|uniref:Uncharacterized protein n=1 Tax=Hypsibius exemplaris TaxID=2072580 RepID=A0A1W0WF95_HYPEX|nr:hypothetical protein BV898_11882 [Hypsibius exemplaris]